jgi:nucleotide-binding universal stress UspA family protein
MIKGKLPYPFETIALAVVFSPRLEALIAETRRFTGLYKAKAVFIHVGKRTSEKEIQLNNYLIDYGFNDSNCIVHWQDGNAVDIILSVCKQQIADLLIIDAIEKDHLLKYYSGTVSREISRRAKCSVLMMVHPDVVPQPFRKIVVNGHDHPKTIHTLNTALYIAEHEGVGEIIAVEEMDRPVVPTALQEELSENESVGIGNSFAVEDSRLSVLLKTIDHKNIEIRIKTISGRSGYTIAQFAQNAKADLLVVNSPDHHLNIFDRIFSHDLEYVLVDLPCNMLLVHSRVF